MKKVIDKSGGREVLTTMSDTIIKTFNDFDVSVELVEAIEGLRFYYFSFKALKSVRMKTVKSFEDDLRYALATDKLEIEAPIPDKQLIGVTVPKKVNQQMFLWKDAIRSKHIPTSGLTVPLGVDDYGEECFLDITTMPHLLIGGATGSGKSVFIHSVINSLVQALGPNELRLILIDTKQAELNLYEGLPHLMVPPIHEANRALRALKWVMNEIERRFDVLREGKFQNIASYHQGRRKKDEGLPYVVVIIDEIADAMQAYPNELESMLVRLAQMGRGVGIHMIISTQRPSVKVISGTLKANIPCRIAMQVVSQMDSRTILDMVGAEKLQGKGDLLFFGSDEASPKRVQSYYISEDEVRKRVESIIEIYKSSFDNLDLDTQNSYGTDSLLDSYTESDDELYKDAKQVVLEAGKASTSLIQRKLRIGYGRAARIMDLLEEQGIIGPADGAAPRKVIPQTE